MDSNTIANLEGLKVVSFESRRGEEMAELIRRYGGDPIVSPSMREIPLSENSAALEFFREIDAGAIDLVIFLTGTGARILGEIATMHGSRENLISALARTTLLARGPKPASVLREWGLSPDIVVPEPNTWRDILAELDRQVIIKGRRVAVQEYGVTNVGFMAGLEARGAKVLRVPVYRWALPENTSPLRSAVREIVAGRVHIALFTNATQVDHLFRIAAEEGLGEKLRQALARVLIASIGPVCSEALEQFKLKPDLEPEHPKMGHFMVAVARNGRRLLEAKRNQNSP